MVKKKNDKNGKCLTSFTRKNYSVNIEGYSMTLLIMCEKNCVNSWGNRWNM